MLNMVRNVWSDKTALKIHGLWIWTTMEEEIEAVMLTLTITRIMTYSFRRQITS